MSDKIEPALTAEEWAAHDPGAFAQSLSLALPLFDSEGDLTSHGLAARALYGQPFGFTREDLAVLLEATGAVQYSEELPLYDDHYLLVALRSLAARIEALLPPEGK